MGRLGPQARKLFEVTEKKEVAKRSSASKKYTFVFPIDLMKQVKHSAVEQERTVSDWVTEAMKKALDGR